MSQDQVRQPDDSDSLEAQIDAMVAQVEQNQAEPNHPADDAADAVNAPPDQSADSPADQPADSPSHDPQNAAPNDASTSDALGHDLADQIQAMLNDAADGDDSPDEAPPGEDQSIEANVAHAPATPGAMPAAPGVTPGNPGVAPGGPPGAAHGAMHAIDDYLASRADEAIAGDFETVTEVLSAEANRPPAARQQLVPLDSEPDTFIAPDDPSTERDDLDGATASDVADELDEQPESKPFTESQPHKAEGKPASPAPVPWKLRLKAIMAIVARGLRYACAAINRPMQRLSPTTRHALGYFALIHIFIGSVLVVGKMISLVIGG